MRIEKFEPQIGAAKSKHDRGVTRSRPTFKRGGINVGLSLTGNRRLTKLKLQRNENFLSSGPRSNDSKIFP